MLKINLEKTKIDHFEASDLELLEMWPASQRYMNNGSSYTLFVDFFFLIMFLKKVIQTSYYENCSILYHFLRYQNMTLNMAVFVTILWQVCVFLEQPHESWSNMSSKLKQNLVTKLF